MSRAPARRALGTPSATDMHADLLDQALRGQQGRRTDLGNNVPEVGRPEGNTEAKALRRLRKDRPDLHAEVLAGLAPRMSAGTTLRALCDAGWRTDLSGRWISPEPAEARFSFTLAAAWRQHTANREETPCPPN